MAHGLDGAMIGFVVSGFFVTVLYYPYFWINLAMTVALNNAAQQALAPESRLSPGWRSARWSNKRPPRATVDTTRPLPE
jgi:hypothetical protein